MERYFNNRTAPKHAQNLSCTISLLLLGRVRTMKDRRQKTEPCQYYYPDLTCFTLPDVRRALSLRRPFWRLKRQIWRIAMIGPLDFTSTTLLHKVARRRTASTSSMKGNDLNLRPGELVEVKSIKEVFAMLDDQNKLAGLRFNPEMTKFCGQRFKVFKRLNKIIIESTGELRRIRIPTVILEGVYCDGRSHGDCDRSCFCFWREAWLKRVDATNPKH